MLLVSKNYGFAQDSTKKDPTIDIAYFVADDKVPYVVITAKVKVDRKFTPIEKLDLKVFMDKDSEGNKLADLGNFKTNDRGKVLVIIPGNIKNVWDAAESHTFFVSTKENKNYNAADANLTVSRAKIAIDTADDKNIKVVVTQLKNKEWIPVKGVEVKVGIQRLDSYLPVGDDPTYTTDSLGTATAEFKKLKIPGDMNGNITLVARIEDNDQFGNINISKQVPWGSKFVYQSTYNERALWSRRTRTPIWLLIMAYSVVIAVWGTLIYLIGMIIRIKKLGKDGAEYHPHHHHNNHN
jgi:hypothetical protein